MFKVSLFNSEGVLEGGSRDSTLTLSEQVTLEGEQTFTCRITVETLKKTCRHTDPS